MKSIALHLVLAVLGLGGAYWVYSGGGEEERPSDEVVVFDCPSASLTKIEFDAEHKDATIDVRPGADGEDPTYWVKIETTPEGGTREASEFVGSDAANELAQAVAPLRALRSLGDANDALLEDLELKEPKTHFAITCGGNTRRFALGATAFGSGDRYIRASNGGPVYLIGSELARDLDPAEFRLMQRELHNFDMKDVETLVVRAYDREARLLHRHRLDPERAEWVDAATPDRRNELYGNWLERIGRLRAQKYLALDAEPGSDLAESSPVERLATLTYLGPDGREMGELELAAVQGDDRNFYARSETTRTWVTVLRSVGLQVEDDARPVVGLDPVPRAVPARPDAGVPGAPPSGATTGSTPATPSPAPAPPPIEPDHAHEGGDDHGHGHGHGHPH